MLRSGRIRRVRGKGRISRRMRRRVLRKPLRAIKSKYDMFSRRPLTNQLVASTPFPEKWFGVFKYVKTQVLTAGTGGVYGTEQIFRLNSLYDPDNSGIGRYPYGFQALSTYYARYMVNYVKIKLTISDPSNSGSVVTCLIQANGNTTSLTAMTVEQAQDLPLSKSKFINSTGDQLQYINISAPSYRISGISKIEWQANPTVYGAPIGSNPTQPNYIRIAVANANGTSGATCVLNTEIYYFSTMYDRLYVTPSA